MDKFHTVESHWALKRKTAAGLGERGAVAHLHCAAWKNPSSESTDGTRPLLRNSYKEEPQGQLARQWPERREGRPAGLTTRGTGEFWAAMECSVLTVLLVVIGAPRLRLGTRKSVHV